MKLFWLWILLLSGVSFVYADVPLAEAEAAKEGKGLHESYCVFCHIWIVDETLKQVYSPKNHRVKDYPALENKVLDCVNELGLRWSNDEVGNISTYLNNVFYLFDEQDNKDDN